MEEIWKDVPCFEGKYQVSSLGRLKRYHNGKYVIMAARHRGHSYLGVTLTKNEFKKDFYIHRLVAEVFIPNPNGLPQVNHKDFNKENNTIDNLEWCTGPENVKHYLEHGKRKKQKGRKKGYKNHKRCSCKGRKAINQYSLDGTLIKKWECAGQIQKELGIWHSNITDCCKGVSKQSHGYVWSYE